MLSCDKVTSRREATYFLGDRVAWILQPGSPYFLQIIKARSLAAFRSLTPSARPKARPLLETAKAPKKWFCCSLWSASSASVLSLLWLWIVRTAGPSIICRSLAIAAEFMVVTAARVKSVFLKMSLPPNVGREKTLSLSLPGIQPEVTRSQSSPQQSPWRSQNSIRRRPAGGRPLCRRDPAAQ